ILAHNGEPVLFGVLLDDVADVAQGCPRPHFVNAKPHALEGDVAKTARQDGGLAGNEHAAGIAKPAVLDDGYVYIEDITVFKDLIARNAVTNDMVDGCADCSRERRVARRCIADGGRLHTQFLHMLKAQAVELASSDAGLDVWSDEIKYGSSSLTGSAHFVEVRWIGNDG